MRNPFGRKDYYAILGVNVDSTSGEIKTAFRSLVKEYHPDKFRTFTQKAWATKKMAELNEAYEILGNPLKRLEYKNGYKDSAKTPSEEKTKVDIYWEEYSGYVGGLLWVISLIFFLYLFEIQNFNPNHIFQSLYLVFIKIFGAAFLSLFVTFGLVMTFGFFLFIPILVIQEIRAYWRKLSKTPSSIIHSRLKTNAQVFGTFAVCGGIGFLTYYLFDLTREMKGPRDFLEGIGLPPIIAEGINLAFGLIAFIFLIIGANLGLIGICILPFVLIEMLGLFIFLIWGKLTIKKTQALMAMED